MFERADHNDVTRIQVGPARALVYGDDARVCHWASERIGLGDHWPSDTVTIALEEGGRLVVAALFNHFELSDCHIHVASDGSRNWARRDVLAAVFAFPFRQIGCSRITAPIASRNKASLIMAIKLGFVPEGRKERALGDDDLSLLVMFNERCPWLPPMED